MTTWIEPPPPQRKGLGCFAKGCLILIAFVILLGAAFAAGTYFAVRFLRGQYFPAQHIQLPASTATPEEQQAVRAREPKRALAVLGREAPPQVVRRERDAERARDSSPQPHHVSHCSTRSSRLSS